MHPCECVVSPLPINGSTTGYAIPISGCDFNSQQNKLLHNGRGSK